MTSWPVLLPLFVAIHHISTAEGSSGFRTVCYYTNWSQYRPGRGSFVPEDVDPSLCTHINYAFAKLEGNHLHAFEWNDEDQKWSHGMYHRFNALKQKNPGLKTLLSLGGWNMGSDPFTKMVATATSRQEFATHSVQFLRSHDFDGLDIDWEYPAKRGSPPGDKAKFVELLQELRRVYDEEARTSGKPVLLLTAAVAAGKDTIDDAYDVPTVARNLDFINLMAYDFHGSFENYTAHHSPLFPRSDEIGTRRQLNLDWAATYWLTKGVPADKLNLGLGLYGRSFTLSSSNSNVGAQISGPGTEGQYTKEKGFLSYYEICQMEKQGGVVHQLPEERVPYIVDGDQWTGFDDANSLALKVNYMKQNHFGGVMVWALDLDDFRDTCGHGLYPLMHAIQNAVNGDGGSIITRPPYFDHTDEQHTVDTVTAIPYPTGAVDMDHFCDGKSDGLYSDPADCHMFYKCSASITSHEPCPPDMAFNPSIRLCDVPSGNQKCI